jgi:hypothetical protein
VIADPPSLAGSVKVTETEALPAVATQMVGASGTVLTDTRVNSVNTGDRAG